jgi:hypothetical protein
LADGVKFDSQSVLTGCILAAIGWLFSATISHSDRLAALEAKVDERLASIEQSLTRVERKLDNYTDALEYAKRLADGK